MSSLSNRTSKRALAALATLAMAVALTGCATTGTSEKAKAPAPAPTAPATAAPVAKAIPAPAASGAMGTVVFFREKKFAGAAVSFKVREGETELGKLSSGTYFIAQLPVGPHEFTVHSEAKDVLHLEIERGETYYVQGSISMGVLVGRPNLSPSNEATFNGMKEKLKNSAEKT